MQDDRDILQLELLLKQRSQELLAFDKLITLISQSSDLKMIMSTALTEIDLTLGLRHSEIWLFDEFFRHLTYVAQHGLPADFSQETLVFKLGEGLAGIIAQSNQPLFIPDIDQDSRARRQDLIVKHNFKSAFGLPLIAQGNLVGVMIFFCSSPDYFAPEVISRLTLIGHLIGAAIQNVRLLQTVRQHLVEQSALVAATTAISSSLDLTTVLRSLAQQMVKTVHATSAYICDWQSENGASTVLTEYFAPDLPASDRISELGVTYYPLVEFHQIGDWLQNGQMMLIHRDDLDLHDQEQAYMDRHKGLSMLLIPFVVKGIVTGCVQVWESRYRRNFTLDELALCQGIAQQGAIALENARLFEQAQREIAERKRAEERLARQAKESDRLNQVRTAIARELELPDLIRIVVESIAAAFEYKLVSLYMFKDDKLALQHQVGYEGITKQATIIRTIHQQTIQTGEAVLSRHPYLDSPYIDIGDDEIKTEICVPIFSQGQVVGTLHVASLGSQILGETDLRLMRMLGEHVSIAFERASLYTEARESEEKYRTLIEQSRDAIYLIYGNRFEIINRKFEELFGVTKEEINDPSFVFTNIIAPKSRKLLGGATVESMRDDRTPVVSPVYEFTALDKNGNEIEVELSVSYPTYKGGLATQGILRDITERKRVETERMAMQAQIVQNAKLASVGELAAGVAHEINNPIFAIREYADLILEDTPSGHPTRPMLQTIIQESNRIADIVRNLLEFARPSETNFNQVHLKEIWRLVYNLIGQSLRKQNIVVEVNIPDDLPLISARRQQLQQVLLNLVTNARDTLTEKYPGQQRHVQKRLSIKASLVEKPGWPASGWEQSHQAIRLMVRDEGMGILPEHQENLFTPFFTTKRHQKGTGLGLSISHRIVEEHHGRIEVKSKLGEFTEFIVTLPVNQP